MRTLYKNSSASVVLGAALTLGTLQGASAYEHLVPRVQTVVCREVSTTPKLIEIQKLTWVEESARLFGEIREFTKEEAKLHEESILSMFKPTGRNISDLL